MRRLAADSPPRTRAYPRARACAAWVGSAQRAWRGAPSTQSTTAAVHRPFPSRAPTWLNRAPAHERLTRRAARPARARRPSSAAQAQPPPQTAAGRSLRRSTRRALAAPRARTQVTRASRVELAVPGPSATRLHGARARLHAVALDLLALAGERGRRAGLQEDALGGRRLEQRLLQLKERAGGRRAGDIARAPPDAIAPDRVALAPQALLVRSAVLRRGWGA